jgi:F0F1-type ATP synthase assembly protein I
MEDNLQIEYKILLGLVSSIAVTVYLTILKTKKLRTKIIGLGAILLIVVIANVFMN